VKSGAETDIITGTPVERLRQEEKLDKEKARKDQLKEQSANIGISRGQDARQLIEMIEKLAIKRIEKLIKDDPEATSYKKILKELGETESIAIKAHKQLYNIPIIT